MREFKPKNIALLLTCLGPVLSILAVVIAYAFAHAPTGEPTEGKAEFYEQAAIYCVTLFLGGVITLFVGLAIYLGLFIRRVLESKTTGRHL